MRGWDEPVTHVDIQEFSTRVETTYKNVMVVTRITADVEINEEVIKRIERNHIDSINEALFEDDMR